VVAKLRGVRLEEIDLGIQRPQAVRDELLKLALLVLAMFGPRRQVNRNGVEADQPA
jgi:hypothetical protein